MSITDPALRGILEEISTRFRHMSAHTAVGPLWAAVAKYQRGTLDGPEFATRVHALVAGPHPDLWIRFCQAATAAEAVPPHLLPAPAVGPLPCAGVAGVNEAVFRQFVVPQLSYPALARLARTCKAWSRSLRPHDYARAVDGYKARTHGRFELRAGPTGLGMLRLWTIDEEPLELYKVSTKVAGMVFWGRPFVGAYDPEVSHASVVEVRWPGSTRRDANNCLSFGVIFKELLNAQPAAAAGAPSSASGVRLWSKVNVLSPDCYLVTLYVRGCARLVRDVENEVFRLTVVFGPSTWRPAS